MNFFEKFNNTSVFLFDLFFNIYLLNTTLIKMVLYLPTCGQQNLTFSGVLVLIRTKNIQLKNLSKKAERVLVVVHKTSTNHFAVIYPIWGLECSKKPIFTINLLSTKVEKSSVNPNTEFSVVSSREGVSFLFQIPDKCNKNYTIDDWVEALTNSNESSTFLKMSSPSLHKSRQTKLNLSVLNEEEVNEEND